MNLSQNTWFASRGQHPPLQDAGVWLSRLKAGLRSILAARAARRRRAQEMQTLYSFTDRELWDLGLGRSDLPGIMNGTYRRD